MWWHRMIFGFQIYHVIMWFLAYGMLGWLVESIYMSICNRKLTNRGFIKSPFCPIYSVGALTVFFVLAPFKNNVFALFFLGSLLATSLEIVTAAIMRRFLGEIWWDYNEKPFNYKGVICLESSIAWGFYTVFLFMFLHKMIVGLVNYIPFFIGKFVGGILLMIFTADFIRTLYREKKDDIPVQVTELKEAIIDRFRF